MQETNGRRARILERALAFTQLGFELLIGAVLGYFLGDWLDRKLGTLPILTVLGVVLFVAAIMVKLYRQLIQLEQDESTVDRESDNSD